MLRSARLRSIIGERAGEDPRPETQDDMTTRVGVGVSSKPSGSVAGREAVEAALSHVDGSADLLVTFATAGYDQAELTETIREVGGAATLVGCSGEGLISRELCSEGMHAVGVMALRSDVIRAETHLVPGYGSDAHQAATRLTEWIGQVGRDDARVLVLLPDGLAGNCTVLLDGLREGLLRERPDLLVVGGTAADGMMLQQSHQYCDDEVASQAVAALLLCGDVTPEVVVSHGCSPLGLPRTITRAHEGWVHELDGRRAWSVFQEYLDGEPDDLNADGTVYLCLGELLPEELAAGYDPYVVHTPLSLDRATGSLFFPGGGVVQGQRVQLMQRDPEKIQRSAHDCATLLASRCPGKDPNAVLQFDCAGRGQAMFGSSVKQRVVDPVLAPFAPSVPWLGLHTYGEIAPLGRRTYYHNYTVALCALFEGRT